ncbi:MAG: NAD-dependent epimerase/dehydratase family protein [Bacteriovoracaceae bacterium]|jgi:UDP-glucose 4-epimerase|nr:NAD-dependent epimerase/dehydratase family protein [Bacteriovoracaceae bacterium]
MLETSEIKNILIIGITGGLAQITAKIISKKMPGVNIIGIDVRDVGNIPPIPGLTCQKVKYSRGNFEKIFRSHDLDVVLHLGRITHANAASQNVHKRLDLSVVGTNTILDLCMKSSIKKIVILSTFHVYGAYPDNPVFIKEDAPLRASIKYPDLRDVVEMDQIATNWVWKNQNQIKGVVLRPCNIIGAQIKNTISQYLAYKYAPYPIDFNPIFQFIHEYDMAHVIYRSITEVPTGTYNVAPNEYISLKNALKKLETPGIPIPVSVVGSIAGFLKSFRRGIPEYLIDYIKFSCLIDNSELKKHLGEDFCKFKIGDALKLINLR